MIYIKDDNKLEGRVCGASFNDWCLGKVKETNCGFRIGAAENMAGFAGFLDDVSLIYCICLLRNRNKQVNFKLKYLCAFQMRCILLAR